MTPVAFGNGLLQPSINSLITQRVPAQDVGGALGLGAAFLSLANVLGPLWGGAADHGGATLCTSTGECIGDGFGRLMGSCEGDAR